MSARYSTQYLQANRAEEESVPLDVRLMHLSASFLVLALVIYLVVAALWNLVRLPIFALEGITVMGEVSHNNAVTLRANVMGRLQGNFFTADLARVRSVFETVPWVRHAKVEREFPNRLRVTLQEHQPVAYWGDEGALRLLNRQGEVFEANLGELEDERLPHLNGPDVEAAGVWQMFQVLGPPLKGVGLTLEGLELTGRGSWRARLSKGGVIELGRGTSAEVLARVQKFCASLPQVAQKLERRVQSLEAADLRHENGYALRMRGVMTLEPAPKR